MNNSEGTSKRLSADARERIRSHPWPGNVRELRNELQRAFIMSEEVIELEGLAPAPLPTAAPRSGAQQPLDAGEGSLDESERRLILATLERCGGDKKRAAEILGISLKTLYNRLHLYAGT
jgi:DNA-binding NtrC family response regulator